MNGPDRRGFLHAGAMALPALAAGGAAARDPGFGAAKRCVLLFLTGGPPQHDTFDPKPDAPAEVRGETRPIATAVPGVRFGDLCPLLARQMHRLCIVRSVTHADTTHTSAGYTMLTGVKHPLANASDIKLIRPSAGDHPHFASLVAHARPPRPGLPAFAALPEWIKDDAINDYPGLGPGFLGSGCGPFLIPADADRAGLLPPEFAPAEGIGADRLSGRRALLERLSPPDGERAGLYRRAYDLIRSPAVQRALRPGLEPEKVRGAYGKHLFGQGCLMARRLLEAGVPLVAVYWHYEGPQDSPVWDTHANHYAHLRKRLLPPADRAVSALIEDLAARGLLGDTLVLCMGEFGRTPRINKDAGRDHWPGAQSVLMAGGGVKAGHVHGATDRLGAYPSASPVSPADLIATVLHLLGVRPGTEVQDRTGRPVPASSGAVVRGVIA